MKMSRRKFFTKTIQTAAVIAIPPILGSVLESCKNTVIGPTGSQVMQTVQGSLANGVVTVTVDSSSPLSGNGNAAIVNFQGGAVLVDHPSDNVYNAVSSICTHQSCQITGFDTSSSQFICPCHGSRFDINGKVKQGPASASLTKYQTQFSGNQLTIKIN